jgi:hypothetical protein
MGKSHLIEWRPSRRWAGRRRIHQAGRCRPWADLNEHSGYADIQAGDKHIADLVGYLEKAPQWSLCLLLPPMMRTVALGSCRAAEDRTLGTGNNMPSRS